jgi:hypothetical protein
MVEFRNSEEAKKRLLAYYKRQSGSAIFPIQKINNYRELEKENYINVNEDDFLITRYIIKNSYELYLTSRRLVIIMRSEKFIIDYKDIDGVFLDVPYKAPNDIYRLNIIVNGYKKVVIEFMDTKSLVEARNEIYRIVKTVIYNWRGEKFTVDNINFKNIKVILIPRFH